MSGYYTPSTIRDLQTLVKSETEISLAMPLVVFDRDRTGKLTTEERAHVLALKKDGHKPLCKVRMNGVDHWVPLCSVQGGLHQTSSRLIDLLLS